MPANARAQGGKLDPAIWRITSVAVLGSFLAQVDATVVNVALASLAVELHTTLGTIQWVTSGYLLALALILPLNGWLVDRIGAKSVYVVCFCTFTLSSALCGLSWSAGSLIGFRLLQGMSGGLLAPMAQIMLARAAGEQMPRVVGIAAMPVVAAPLLGPILAGAILRYASWRWLFLINLPIGSLALILAVLFLPSEREERRPRELDVLGLALLSPGLALFLYGADHIAERVGGPALAAALLLLGAFVWVTARKGRGGLIDLRLFKKPTFSAAVTIQFLNNGVSFAGQMLIPVYLIRGCGDSPSKAGLLLIPMGLGLLCAYASMGRVTKTFGVRRVSATGALLALAGTVPLAYLAGHRFSLIVFAFSLFLRGVGLGAIGVPSVSAAYTTVERDDLPMAATALNIIQRLGGPTLTTLCAIVLTRTSSLNISHGAPMQSVVSAFILVCFLQVLLLAATSRLPKWPDGAPHPAST